MKKIKTKIFGAMVFILLFAGLLLSSPAIGKASAAATAPVKVAVISSVYIEKDTRGNYFLIIHGKLNKGQAPATIEATPFPVVATSNQKKTLLRSGSFTTRIEIEKYEKYRMRLIYARKGIITGAFKIPPAGKIPLKGSGYQKRIF